MTMNERLPGWVATHPVLWGILISSLLFLLALFLFAGDYWPVWLVASTLFGTANTFVWRRGGPAHRWRARALERFPKRT